MQAKSFILLVLLVAAWLPGTHANQAPAIGERMPELTVYTAAGEPVGLRKLLRGHYTVLVLGCLT